jgi:hypothetical protein
MTVKALRTFTPRPCRSRARLAGDAASLDQRVRELVRQFHDQQPDLSATQLANMVNAAACPAVAGMSNLSARDKSAMLMRLSAEVDQQIAGMASPSGSHVLATVPLAPDVAQQINSIAAAHHQTPDAYLRDLITKQAGVGK